MQNDALKWNLWCALVGVARAVYAAAPGIDLAPAAAVVQQGLRAAEEPAAMQAAAEALHAEKARLVPDCMACASPCGRTFDAAPAVMAAALAPDGEADGLKHRLVLGLQRLALLPPAEFAACADPAFHALFALGEGWEPELLQKPMDELQAAMEQRKVGMPF